MNTENQNIEFKESWRDEYLKWICGFANAHHSLPHNPDIANTFFRAGFIESWGRGIEKICTLSKNYGIPEPEYTVHPGDIMLKFLATKEAEDQKVTEKVTEKVTGKVIEKQMTILKEMENNPFVTAQQLSEILSISLRKTKENITKLKDKGIIRRVGPDKGGHWEIIKEG